MWYQLKSELDRFNRIVLDLKRAFPERADDEFRSGTSFITTAVNFWLESHKDELDAADVRDAFWSTKTGLKLFTTAREYEQLRLRALDRRHAMHSAASMQATAAQEDANESLFDELELESKKKKRRRRK